MYNNFKYAQKNIPFFRDKLKCFKGYAENEKVRNEDLLVFVCCI